MECTVRFKNPNNTVDSVIAGMLSEVELASVGRVIGGFYFKTDRTPLLILVALETLGIHFTDLDSIVFEPV